MGKKADDKPNTPALSLPPGLHTVAEVVAAEGPDTTRDQLARRRRKVFLQDPQTGVLFSFPEPPEFWRTPTADEVLATGTLTRLRPRGGTLLHPEWPIPNFESITIIVSDAISAKPPPFRPGGHDVAVLSGKSAVPAATLPEASPSDIMPAVSPLEESEPAPPPERKPPTPIQERLFAIFDRELAPDKKRSTPQRPSDWSD
jgi:hypothetical protein